MGQKEKRKSDMEEADFRDKRVSQKTLTFYIISLCLFAIALILISYIFQVRADQQVDSLSSKLNEQQTVAQGATQKMEVLQTQLQEKMEELDKIRAELNIKETGTDISTELENRQKKQQATDALLQIVYAVQQSDIEKAKELLHDFTGKYEQEELESAGELLGEQEFAIYQSMLKAINE